MRKKRLRAEQIRTKLVEIEESTDLVKENLPHSFEDFAELGLVKDGIYKRMEFAIENVFDICAIINSDLRLELPESDEGILENLVNRGILTREMSEMIRKMKGFRNIIVHRYGKIDDEIAYRNLVNNIDDFYRFIDQVEDFLEKMSISDKDRNSTDL